MGLSAYNRLECSLLKAPIETYNQPHEFGVLQLTWPQNEAASLFRLTALLWMPLEARV